MASSIESLEMCNFLVLDALKENSVYMLIYAIGTYSKIEILTSLALCNEKGETPLVIAMKKNNSSVIDELITWILKKDIYKKEECKPIVIKIVDQLTHHFLIVEVIDYLAADLYNNFYGQTYRGWLKFVVKVLTKSTSFTRQDKILALELFGALIMFTTWGCLEKFSSGLNYWIEAMFLRYFPEDDEPILPKTPAVYVSSASSSVVFGLDVEVMTVEGFQQLVDNFDRIVLSGDSELQYKKLLYKQALIVIRRITSQANHENICWIYLVCLLHFANRVRKLEPLEYQIATNSYLLILEQMSRFDPKMFPHKSFLFFRTALAFILIYFQRKLTESPGSPGRKEVSYANLLATSIFISTIAKRYPDSSPFVDFVYYFMNILNSISPQLTNQERQKLETFCYDYIRDFPSRKSTVLHSAVTKYVCGDSRFLRTQTIQLILTLGADPNAIDEKGRTAFHILAGTENLHFEVFSPRFKILVDAGTHLDMATDDDDTILSVLKNNMTRFKLDNRIVHPYYESLIKTVFPLSCYCARVIRRNGIRFDEDRLPLHLQTFVARHSAKD